MSRQKSVVTEYMSHCIICGNPAVEIHHLLEGTGKRHLSDSDGLIIPLCHDHHQGNISVHMTRELQVFGHIIGELAWEKKTISETHCGEEEARVLFRNRFGKTYI